MEEEEEEEASGARCCCWPLVVTEAGKDNRRRHMAGEESGVKRENKAAAAETGARTHTDTHTSGAFCSPLRPENRQQSLLIALGFLVLSTSSVRRLFKSPAHTHGY